MSHSAPPTPPRLTLRVGQLEKQYWRDLWRYRELFYFLTWRDITVRYKQTAIGMAWALIRPFITMVIFSIIFGNLARLPTQSNAPYQILVYSALLPWQFFSSALGQCSNSLLANAGLLSKVYFPRLIAPATTIVTSFVDFMVAGMILLGLMAWYQFVPSWQIITLPFFVLVAAAAALGIGLWFSSLTVKYRDIGQIVPFVIQVGLYASPVGYSSTLVPEKWRLLYSLNPMVGVIEGFRWAILGGESQIYLPGFALSIVLIIVLLITGVRHFRQVERTFVDIV
ncbi:ABC transporter permease [Leptolyngbya sp. AN03gr2]|uniref:ABC transporter permease n=1 Tax=unclassified Leptolyngbya TaxID=2650499 RepID=UPI003D31F9A2